MKNTLSQIHENMPVYDREGNKIGTVKAVQLGDEDLARPGVETATAQTPDVPGNELVEDLARALDFEAPVPAEIRTRFERYGYIRIDTGLLSSDRYACADQVTKVTADRVDLDAVEDDLVKL